MIIVTGATGHLGRLVVEQLLARVPINTLGVSVRHPDKAADWAALGVRVRHGDFDHPQSLLTAFEDATQILLISSNAEATGGDPLAQHRAAINAARAVGARRVVYTSHMAASDTSAFPPMKTHFATENMLRDSGLAWTALRNGFYGESGLMLMGDALKGSVIEAPVDGKIAWTDHTDLAEAASIILANEGQYDGPTPMLTGSEALDLANAASTLLGLPVQRRFLADDELRARMAARGLPDQVVTLTLGLYIASRNGEFASLDPTLERLIGRAPVRMLDLIKRKVAEEAT